VNSFRQIFNLPPIVQGAIGSALFWLVLVLSQKAIGGFAKFEGVAKKESLWRELIHEKWLRQRLPIMHLVLTVCQYQALSFLTRGAILLGLGLLLTPVSQLFLAIGAAGFLYYAYRALRWLKPFTVEPKESDLQVWQRVAEVETQLFGAAESDTLQRIESLKQEVTKK
jgi:hypothetical protein